MKKTSVAGLIDVIRLDSLGEIRELSENPAIERRLDRFHPVVNGLFLGRLLGLLSFRGERFPTMRGREAADRAAAQDQLWSVLSDRAKALREGPVELEPLAHWIKWGGDERELGRLIQEAVGRMFDASYVATEETWKAAVTMGSALGMRNPLKMLAWRVTGRTRKAKTLLALKVSGNLAGVHGTGVALHNIVKSLKHMRVLYSNIGMRESLSLESVTQQCLFAPDSVLRQATSAGTIGGCPFRRGALFLVALGQAQKAPGSDELVFMEKTWSRCPAEQWVPALVAGIWTRATR